MGHADLAFRAQRDQNEDGGEPGGGVEGAKAEFRIFGFFFGRAGIFGGRIANRYAADY
jgi:hypothetical protein